jgi:hypothetical protein
MRIGKKGKFWELVTDQLAGWMVLVSSYLYICQPTLLVSKVVKWSVKNEDRILFLA